MKEKRNRKGKSMKKILLVDDEKGVVAMMKSYFEMSGY